MPSQTPHRPGGALGQAQDVEAGRAAQPGQRGLEVVEVLPKRVKARVQVENQLALRCPAQTLEARQASQGPAAGDDRHQPPQVDPMTFGLFPQCGAQERPEARPGHQRRTRPEASDRVFFLRRR
ncbi:MAG: hypothetical protein V9G98_04305 [Candidatus Competibacter sp.]